MSRRFAYVTLGLVSAVAFLIGVIAAGSLVPAPAASRSGEDPAVQSMNFDTPRRADMSRRLRLADSVSGVVVSRADSLSAAWDAGIQRGYVLMEINRQPVSSVESFQRIARGSRPGDVMALYVYIRDLEQRSLRAIRIEGP